LTGHFLDVSDVSIASTSTASSFTVTVSYPFEAATQELAATVFGGANSVIIRVAAVMPVMSVSP
jgi:hypothetical protein